MAESDTIDKTKAFAPDRSVFVSANAGAGKTTLLVNRVLSLMLSGVEPSKILCLTFTKAAAAEMSNRILKRLGEWVMMSEKALISSLFELMENAPDSATILRARGLFAQVLEAPEGMRIQTIHGFCQSLLKRFPIEAGISPHFAVMDDRTEQEMLAEARLRLFNNARGDDVKLQASIHAFAHRLSESSLSELLNEIVKNKRKFYALFQRPLGVEGAIESLWRLMELPPDVPLKTIMAKHFDYDQATLSALRGLIALLAQGEKTDRKTAEGLTVWLEHRSEALIDRYCSVFITQDGSPRKTLSTKNTLNASQAEILRAEQLRIVRFCEEWRAMEVATGSVHLLRVAAALLSIYDGLKRAYARMDYDDLILHSVALLKRPGISPWVLFKLDGGIDHVLVDEAQDTSPEQWTIIDALTQEFFAGEGRAEGTRSLFIVGDEKQSIFSFQGANVKELAKRQQYFITRIKEAAAQAERIALIKSFRSTDEVLKAVDAVFAQPEASSGLMFEQSELKHIPTRGGQAGLVEVWPLLEADDAKMANLQLAQRMADIIRDWVENGFARPGDIMVLVRRRNAFVDQLSRALKRRNIPVAGIDRMILSDNLAVQDLMALGQILLLPEDDLTLASLLKSPICNVSEDELFELAWNREKQSLWERLGQSKIASCKDAYALLADLRARVDFVSPYELYSYLLDTVGARRKFTGRMGDEYADPIDEFLMQSLTYEKSHTPSLQGYLHWLTSSDSQIKRDMEQARDSVRIMTVHGAKGLQAPIVLLPDTIEPPESREKLLWHEEGFALWPLSSKRDDARTGSLRAERQAATMEEYRRLLYVALTRAEDRLYIFGAKGKDKISAKSWYQLIRDGLAQHASSFDTPHGEGLRLGNPDLMKKREIAKQAEKETTVFPFLQQLAPDEPSPPKPLAPSRLTGDEPPSASPLSLENAFQRGIFIHRLLQHLPQVPQTERRAIAKRFATGFALDAIDEAIEEAIRVIEDKQFAFLFSGDSMAEVPVAGTVTFGDKKLAVSGQLDRLYVGENEVWIVDYKTNRLPPAQASDAPMAYLRQLGIYRALLKEIYPTKTIRCALLWTAAGKIDVIDEGLLDEASLSSYI